MVVAAAIGTEWRAICLAWLWNPMAGVRARVTFAILRIGQPVSPASDRPDGQPPATGPGGVLARALQRARWSIFWERLWPALASVATAVGLFLALSWLGLWLALPPLGRAVGVFLFFVLAVAATVPLFLVRVPSRN